MVYKEENGSIQTGVFDLTFFEYFKMHNFYSFHTVQAQL